MTHHISAAVRASSADALLLRVSNMDAPVAAAYIAAAQVHATLALAEQQRIANLIALERLHRGWRPADVRHVAEVPMTFTLEEIEAGLDLEDIAERRGGR